MGREKKPKKPEEGAPQWMVTFSDLVTLLLTFFVLLLSMASMDKSILVRVNLFQNDVGMTSSRAAGRIPTRVELLIRLLENPQDVVEKPNRFKDLLFPDEFLPPEINRSTLYKNLKIMKHPDGLSLVLTDKLLFDENSSLLTEVAKKLLYPVYEVLLYLDSDVNIAGYSDNVINPDINPLTLSGDRALAVLRYFVRNGLDQIRFSVSGYGPYLPVASNTTAEGRAENRRVEVLIKTTPLFRGYQSL